MATKTREFIKGRIAEVMVDHLLRDVGFFVLPFGKEHGAAPLINVQQFVKECDGNFKFTKDPSESKAKKLIDILPDFIAVHKSGETKLIEVKYRKNGWLTADEYNKIFELYPETVIVLVGLEFQPYPAGIEKTARLIDDPKNSRFNVLRRDGNTGNNIKISSCSLARWFIEEHKCDPNKANEIISEYEEYVREWYSEQKE